MKTIGSLISSTAIASLLLMAGAGCVPVFTHALPVPDPPLPDATLLGSWGAAGPNADGELAHIAASPDGWLDIVYVQNGGAASDRGLRVTRYEGFTTPVGSSSILCFRERHEGAPRASDGGFLLATYGVDPGNQLTIRLFAQTPVQAMIEAGVLEGLVKKTGEQGTEVRVTASSERLLEVLLAQGVDAFTLPDQALVFTRLAPVATAP